MINREITYYSLLSSENLRHIEQMAATMDEQSFVTLGFDHKWFCHLWIGANNEAFLEYISPQTDLTKLDRILGEQLKLYARKQGEGYEKDKGDFYGTYKARKDWLNHTIFICRNEYNKTQNEVFNEVVKWCVDWQNEWLETFNPYSPTEHIELSKDLKTPLWEQLNEDETSLPPQQTETKTEQEQPKTFAELFYNPEHAEPCLKILNELQPPVIDAINNYIGKAKGVFPLWVKVLKNHKPEPLIKHFKDTVYKDLLNQKVNGLNLSKDASEFRKQYVRLENDKIELDIKTILSQYSQSGKLGK